MVKEYQLSTQSVLCCRKQTNICMIQQAFFPDLRTKQYRCVLYLYSDNPIGLKVRALQKRKAAKQLSLLKNIMTPDPLFEDNDRESMTKRPEG